MGLSGDVMGTPIPMLPDSRPVEAHWKCHQSGECCTQPYEVVMTREERTKLLPHIPQGVKSEWREVDDRFVGLKARPCPFYIFHTCQVYEVRPYNCRRFGCLRPNPKQEPFDLAPDGTCRNLLDRVKTSRIARRLAVTLQRRAQRWARQHGWTEE